jgi:hypothetical protein
MNRLLITTLLPLVAMLALWGCTEESHDIVLPPDGGDNGGGEIEDKATCLGCHSSEEMLKASLAKESGSKVLIGDKGDG